MKSIKQLLFACLLALATTSHAQLYPVVNFRWHDGYRYFDPTARFLTQIGIGNFPELEYVYPPAGSLWFVYTNGPPTCTGTCTDSRFTGCTFGSQTAISWPPTLLGTPVQDSGGALAGAYLTLSSSRVFDFAGDNTGWCGNETVDGVAGQKTEICDSAVGRTDANFPYFLRDPVGQLSSVIYYFAGGITPAFFHAEQSGSDEQHQIYPSVAFWIKGNGNAVTSSLDLTAFTDGTARWYGMWKVNYKNLGCLLKFPLEAVAVGQP